MKELSLQEQKDCCLKILISIHNFCVKNNIRYSISYGTLIGAIRHQGFIPWDDDIDIIMPRNDYNTFIGTYHDSIYELLGNKDISNHLHYVVHDPRTRVFFSHSESDQYYYKGGIWVDVFPIDGVPDDVNEYRNLKNKIHQLVKWQRWGEVILPWQRKKLWKLMIWRIIHIVARLFRPYFDRRLFMLMNSNNTKDTRMVGDLSLHYTNFPSFPRSYLEQYKDVDFEGFKVKSMKDYDPFLKAIYGNYMEFPPIKERIPKHGYKAYSLK